MPARDTALFIALPLAVTLSATACRRDAPQPTPRDAGRAGTIAVRVKTAAIEPREMPRLLTLTGSIVADRQSDVAANVAGRVLSAPVERGQSVRQGDTLAIVDARAAGFSAAAAAAQVKAAETQVAQARADCERAESLLAKGALSKAEYDRLHTQCTAQVYSATAVKASADLAQKNVGDTTIRAPFDGTVGERYVNVGEYVQPQARVVSLYRIRPVRIQISVPEEATPLVTQGATLEVHVAAFGERTFPATVRYIAPALRPQTRDLIVEAVAPNPDGALKPGMFATVMLEVGRDTQPTVPAEAIRTEGTTHRIFIARGQVAWEMVVRTGATREGRTAVLEAFNPEDRVIVSPPPGLHDGSAISE